MRIKDGRPCKYHFIDFGKPLTSQVVVDLLGELRQRTEDQIADLTMDQLNKPFSKQNITASWLFLHLNWAELNWLIKITGQEPQENTRNQFYPGKIDESAQPGRTPYSPQDLVSLSQKHFTSYVTPALLHQPIDFSEQKSSHPDLNAGQIFAHLFWHWSYHSGQIGLLGLMGGQDYRWHFE